MGKDIVFAEDNRELFLEIRDKSGLTVKNIPYLSQLVNVVKEEKPQFVIFSPYLKESQQSKRAATESVDWRTALYELTMLDDVPRIIFLAGNVDKKDEIIEFVLTCEVRDIIFNPPSRTAEPNVIDTMFREVMDRIRNPRSRKQVFEELGIVNRKQLPTGQLAQLGQLEQQLLNTAEAVHPSETAFGSEPFSQEEVQTPQTHRPYLIAVISPASAGASQVAHNVAAALALEDFTTALVDMDKKRTLHYLLGRDSSNQSFVQLFSYGVLEGERTRNGRLDAFTSPINGEFYGDAGWMETILSLHYEVVVLDFSSGSGWRIENLLAALDRCDEIVFVADMDYSKAQQSRAMLDQLSQSSNVPIRLALNKYMPEHVPIDLHLLLPLFHSYEIGFHPEVYTAIVQGISLVELKPDLRMQFLPKELQRGVSR